MAERKRKQHFHNNKKPKTNGFQAFGLLPDLLNGISKCGYLDPTPIQHRVLPLALSGKDVVAMARTGSGKTAAFLLPLLNSLEANSSLPGARGLVLSPTRELAQQTYGFAIKIGRYTSLKMCLIQGGDKLEAQFTALNNNPDVLICAPGRLAHLIVEMKSNLILSRVKFLVFDEADRLFEMGFKPQIDIIMKELPPANARQTMLVSATLPKQLEEFTKGTLANPVYVRLDSETKLPETLSLAFFRTRSQEKIPALLLLLKEYLKIESDQTIIFVATKHHVDYLQRVLKLALSVEVSVAYSSLDQESRQHNLDMFRQKKTNILLVTDVAARGIDIPLLSNVVNFHFPATKSVKLFLHRVGRAARQGRKGLAISLVTNEELPYMIEVCTFCGITPPQIKLRQKSNEADNRIADRDELTVNDDPLPIETNENGYSIAEMTPEQIDFGNIPATLIQPYSEKFERLRINDAELQSLERSVENAFQLFTKTKESASRSSIARAKEVVISLKDNIVHPWFISAVSGGDQSNLDFGALLKNFRPKETIFEINEKKTKTAAQESGEKNVAKASESIKNLRAEMAFRKKITQTIAESKTIIANDEGTPNDEAVFEEMEISTTNIDNSEKSSKRKFSKAERKRLKKREVTASELRATHENDDALTKKTTAINFRAAEFISNEVSNEIDPFAVGGSGSNRNDIMELLPDEQKALLEKKKSYHWDKRKKRYIMSTDEEHLQNKRIRNEAGQMIKKDEKGRGDIFQKWQQNVMKNNIGVTPTDDPEDGRAERTSKFDVRTISKNLRETEKLSKAQNKQIKKSKDNDNVVLDEAQLEKALKKKEMLKEKNVHGRKKIVMKKRNERMEEEAKKRIFNRNKKTPIPSKNRFAKSRIVTKSNFNKHKTKR